ncbi:hypothetical protein DL96DRAFT_279876 [Flagelloscypha sp. PMI_526]|nr:hypothetical protein DL96DRAFT_279876 [Flagelloscypha sp. PMI_526]
MDISTFPSSVVRADNFANSANPSCTLPSELLASIFLIHRDNSLNLFEASLSGHASLHLDLLLLKGPIVRMIPWLWPSHCCRAWRTVALSTPTLWDTFSLRNTSCTTELLRRSGTGVLLHLSLPFDAGASGCSSLALVLNTASAARVRKLELNIFCTQRLQKW